MNMYASICTYVCTYMYIYLYIRVCIYVCTFSYLHAYCKWYKLSERKVLQFIGFHPNVGKVFVVFASSLWKVLKEAIAELNIRWKTFSNSSKICKNCETFLSLKFCGLQYKFVTRFAKSILNSTISISRNWNCDSLVL